MSTSKIQSVAQPLPEYVDWLVAACIAVTGLALTVGGSALLLVADRELLAGGIESGHITVGIVDRSLTEAEMLSFTTAVVNWTSIGLLVTGLGLVLFALGFVIVRHRTHHRVGDADAAGSLRSYAVFGAVATVILSFLPFSPVFGGGLAAYLADHVSERSMTVGALSGILAVVPILVILGFVTIGIFTGLSGLEKAGLGALSVAAMGLITLLVAVYGAGTGALGGFLGGRFAEQD